MSVVKIIKDYLTNGSSERLDKEMNSWEIEILGGVWNFAVSFGSLALPSAWSLTRCLWLTAFA